MKWHEYALEVYDKEKEDSFSYQIDCFQYIREAKKFIKENPLEDSSEYYVIKKIEYERDGDDDYELSTEVVYEEEH